MTLPCLPCVMVPLALVPHLHPHNAAKYLPRFHPRFHLIQASHVHMSTYYTGSTLDYHGQFTLLQNACIRYDKGHKNTFSAASRVVYQHDSQDYHPSSYPSHEVTDHADTGTITDGIDMPAEAFYHIHTTSCRKPPPVGSVLPKMTEFRQTLQVQSHLEMPGILVQLGHIQHT